MKKRDPSIAQLGRRHLLTFEKWFLHQWCKYWPRAKKEWGYVADIVVSGMMLVVMYLANPLRLTEPVPFLSTTAWNPVDRGCHRIASTSQQLVNADTKKGTAHARVRGAASRCEMRTQRPKSSPSQEYLELLYLFLGKSVLRTPVGNDPNAEQHIPRSSQISRRAGKTHTPATR